MILEIDNYPGYWIKKAVRTMNIVYDRKLQKYDLTSAQISVLCQLWKKDGITQKEIQSSLNLRPASVTGIVDTISSKGWIVRNQDEKDARLRRIYLTDEGRKLEKISTEIIKELEEIITKGFSQDERTIFVAWIKKAYSNLEFAREL